MGCRLDFESPEEAQKVVNHLNGKHVQELGNSRLFVDRVFAVTFVALRRAYDAARTEIQSFCAHNWETLHVSFKITNHQAVPSPGFTHKTVIIRLYGKDIKAIVTRKTVLENMLAGEVAVHHDAFVWDDFIAGHNGIPYLNTFGRRYNAFIYRDSRCHQLRLIGCAVAKKNVLRVLGRDMETRSRNVHNIILPQEASIHAWRGAFHQIIVALGKHAVKLNLVPRTKSVAIYGSDEDLQKAKEILAQSASGSHSPHPSSTEDDCAICFTEATEPYHTPCGHLYCADCLQGQCSSETFPGRCYGEAGACSHIFTLEELRSALSADAFNEPLASSFATFMRTHPGDFAYCPSPECDNVYRVTKDDGKRAICPSCMTAICTTCKVIQHDGMTCYEYQDIVDETRKDLRRWMRDHDAKECPKCRTAIQKRDGCNHIICAERGAHICWFCLKVFNTSQRTYDHMTRRHGGIGLDEAEGLNDATVDDEHDEWEPLRNLAARNAPRAPRPADDLWELLDEWEVPPRHPAREEHHHVRPAINREDEDARIAEEAQDEELRQAGILW